MCLIDLNLDSSLWTPQLLLDSSKNRSNTVERQIVESSIDPNIHTTNAEGLCIIHTPANEGKPNNPDTRATSKEPNNFMGGNKRDISDTLINRDKRKISRAESVKNSRRYYKKKSSTNQVKGPTTILSSYLPLKHYMVKEMNFSRPVRQMQREKKHTLKTPFSQRNGLGTAKNAMRKNPNETFDEFVFRMKKQQSKNQYPQVVHRTRPYTSSGWSNLRIKQNKRPSSKSGVNVKNYNEARSHPYAKNRQFVYKDNRKKSNNRGNETKVSNLLNESDTKNVNHRWTFYPTGQESFVNNKTDWSYESHGVKKQNYLHHTYFENNDITLPENQTKRQNEFRVHNPGKESVSTKNTSSCNQTTTDMSMETKPLSQRKSFVNDPNPNKRIFEMSQKNFRTAKTNMTSMDKGEVEVINRYYDNNVWKKRKVGDLIHCEDHKENHRNSSQSIKDPEIINNTAYAAPLPRNFKRIPAMLESFTKKEELIQRAQKNAVRGRSESTHKIQSLPSATYALNRSESERPGSIKDYKLGRQIGKGAYAIVKLVSAKYKSPNM